MGSEMCIRDSPKGSPVEITYSYDSSGRINASARELTGGNEASTQIVRDAGMQEPDVEAALKTLADEYTVE